MIRYILSTLILLILSTIMITWRRHHKPRYKKSILNKPTVNQNEINRGDEPIGDERTGLKPVPTKQLLSNVGAGFKPARIPLPSSENVALQNNNRMNPLNIIHEDELYIPIPLTATSSAQKIMPQQENVSEILSIVIEANKTKSFEGYNLLQTILATDLHYGAQRLFHKYKDANCTTILFSLAAGKEGKGFDLKDMRSLNCSELILSMDTKATSEPKEVYNFMLAVAKQLSNNLGGKITAQNMQGKL